MKFTIDFDILQRLQEEKRVRDAEIKRRETERKIRHEKLARDGKKSFFELEQSTSQEANANEKSVNPDAEDKKSEVEEGEVAPADVEKSPPRIEEVENAFTMNENDLNALDYEADKDDNVDEPETTITVQRVEVEYKDSEKPSKSGKHNEIEEKSRKKDTDSKKTERRRRSRSREKRSKDRDRRHSSRGRNDRRVYNRRREYSPYRDNRRRDAHRFAKRNRSRSASHDRSRKQRHRDSRYIEKKYKNSTNF